MAVTLQVAQMVLVALPALAALSGEVVIITVPVRAAAMPVGMLAMAAAEVVMVVPVEMAVVILGMDPQVLAPVVLLIVMSAVPAVVVEDGIAPTAIAAVAVAAAEA